MTVTLVSSGNNSLVTDGTGPSLQIRGLSGGIGINVGSSSTTLIPAVSSLRNVQRFYDDFNYQTAEFGNYLNDGTNPLWKNHLWNAEGVTGVGVTMTSVTSIPESGCGVVLFENSFDPLWIFSYPTESAWEMDARNAAMTIGTNHVIYETLITVQEIFDTFHTWVFKIGLKSNSGGFVGFEFNRMYDSTVKFIINGGQEPGPTWGSLFDNWIKLKMVFNSTAGAIEFYINNVLEHTFTGQTISGYHYPYMYAYVRINDNYWTKPGFRFYLDYIDYIGTGQRQ